MQQPLNEENIELVSVDRRALIGTTLMLRIATQMLAFRLKISAKDCYNIVSAFALTESRVLTRKGEEDLIRGWTDPVLVSQKKKYDTNSNEFN